MGRRLATPVAAATGAALAFAVLISGGATAEPGGKRPGVAQPGEIARVRYREGAAAFRDGRYREAIDFFLAADELVPSAALSFNIARSYEAIDDAAAALRWYRDYLRRSPDAKDRAEVEVIVQGLEQRLAQRGLQQVTVMAEPAGATVVLDGHPVGVAPWTGETQPGAHQLELRLDGYTRDRRSIELPPDHALLVTVTLAPEAAAPPPQAPSAAPVASQAPPPTPPPAKDRDEPPYETLGWIGVAAGGALLGGALVFEVLRRGSESDAEAASTQIAYADAVDTMQGRQTAARALAGAGLIVGATGGVMLWLGRDESGEGTHVAVACGADGFASSVRGSF